MPLAAGEFGQTKWHLVGVRGYVGTIGGKRSRDLTGSPMQAGVLGIDDTGDTIGNGVAGWSEEGRGVYGLSMNQAGVVGESGNFDGVFGSTENPTAAGVSGHNPGGLAGWFDGKVSVNNGNVELNNGNLTVRGLAKIGEPINWDNNIIYTPPTLEVTSTVDRGMGIASLVNSGVAIFGMSQRGAAGVFNGDVSIGGTLNVTGDIINFQIDHPLDPENKYLNHRYVESSERKNIYDGIIVLDNKGEGSVQLPKWSGALNENFRYQLTCIGGFAPVYIAEEIKDNSFKIAGGQPDLKVCWQVTGNRKDPWSLANPVMVEEDKPERERGKYRFPEGYGADSTKSIVAMQMPSLTKDKA